MALSTASSRSRTQIRSSLSRWSSELGEDLRPLFLAFVDETLNRLRGPFLAHHPPKQVLAMLEEAFRFALERPPGTIKLDIRSPRRGDQVVLANLDDQPFIVDTIRLFLRASKATYTGGFNLVFRAIRDGSGRLVGVGGENGAHHESLVMIEAEAPGATDDRGQAIAKLRQNLEHARAMVTDFKAMSRAVGDAAFRCDILADRRPDRAEAMRETANFLKWLASENFVFMGIEAGGTKLGIQRLDGPYQNTSAGLWPPPHDPGTVQVRKSQIESPVHRAGRIDEILVTIEEGDVLFLRGMFTYRAVTQPSRNVPILRRVLAAILEDQSTTGPGSFRYKGIANVFDSLPTEFLFTATRQTISDLVDLVFDAEQQQEVGVTLMMSGIDSAFCLVAMPKTQWGDDLRRQIERLIVEATSATYCDHGVFVGRYDTVLMHYFVTGVDDPGPEALRALEERIRQLAMPWHTRLWVALEERHGEEKADELAEIYGRAFPDAWTRTTPVGRAVVDIDHLAALPSVPGGVTAELHEEGEDLILRVYQIPDVYLSDLLPVLTNFGMNVIDSFATPVTTRDHTFHLDTFRLAGAAGIDRQELLARAELFTDAVTRVFSGAVTDDRMNGLVATAGLSWREVDVIRGYSRYCRQLAVKLSVMRIIEILLSNPQMVTSLVGLFHARFDPDLEGERAAAMKEADEAVGDQLRYIRAHDEDLLFSSIRNLMNATVRTNAYRTDHQSTFLSFKIAADQVQRIMGPNKPMFEIYVHSRDVEGVHLRFGKVARGGIRWSDRDDYRTEVLGLVTTQRVKNVVIVPTGSKGGFYLKNASRDPAERRRQADELYKTFIRGLLEVTDNTEAGKLVPPPRVVRHDEDDPYLVVAADKGTAHLSDTANQLSNDYGFWLGDAFASGGSNGYDHKKVGITARGGWVLVRRHFAEMGIDPYTQDVTVAGVGDMGGDVFGNGLIESRHLKLEAAFNHVHIFLDPDPDPERSYVERKRLFDAVGGWDKYDLSALSAGGGVFDRRGKSVPLSKQAQVMLGLEKDEAQPEDVIRAILRMDVDLLWNGGIGTYIKASTETHADADDRSNDDLRIDATQIRARIIGEGGNLGLTQKGRIEAGLLGIRLNTDAIDNSGGVDLSDHEVNLKILLDRVCSRGEMTTEQRNALLEEMTEEVADLVLADNDTQGRQLSRDQIRSRENVFAFGRAIAFVEKEFGRDRASLDLPSAKELERRATLGLGLTRPELSVLSAWVKMWVKRELAKGDPRLLPAFDTHLSNYFPERVRTRFADDIRNHMLAKDIGITVIVTRLIADVGAAFFPMAIEATGATATEIATAYLRAQIVADTDSVRRTLEELRTSVSLDALYRAWIEVDSGAREVAMLWLSARGTIPSEDRIQDMRAAVDQVYALQASDVVARNRAKFEALRSQDIPEAVAKQILKARYLNIALTVWTEATRTGESVDVIAIRHLAIGRASRLQEVIDDLSHRPASGRWEPIGLHILHGRFSELLRELVGKCPVDVKGVSVDVLEPQLAEGTLSDVRCQVDDLLAGEPSPSVATLLVLEERVAGAVTRLT
jgi:glutamate dehydrogenase